MRGTPSLEIHCLSGETVNNNYSVTHYNWKSAWCCKEIPYVKSGNEQLVLRVDIFVQKWIYGSYFLTVPVLWNVHSKWSISGTLVLKVLDGTVPNTRKNGSMLQVDYLTPFRRVIGRTAMGLIGTGYTVSRPVPIPGKFRKEKTYGEDCIHHRFKAIVSAPKASIEARSNGCWF